MPSEEKGAERGEEAIPPEKNGRSEELEETVDDVPTLEVARLR